MSDLGTQEAMQVADAINNSANSAENFANNGVCASSSVKNKATANPKTNTPFVVYFSSATENTRRFVEKLGFRSMRVPLLKKDGELHVREPYVLIVPSYGGGNIKGAVPKQVIKFLNEEQNRRYCLGVIASGNTNFGEAYGIAGDIISAKLKVPYLFKFELLGTPTDVEKCKAGLEQFWNSI